MKKEIVKASILVLMVFSSVTSVAQTVDLPKTDTSTTKKEQDAVSQHDSSLMKSIKTEDKNNQKKLGVFEENKINIKNSKFAIGGVNGGGENPAPIPTNAIFSCDLRLLHRYTRVGRYDKKTPYSIEERDQAQTKVILDLSRQSIGVRNEIKIDDWIQDEDNVNPVKELEGHRVSISGISDSKEIDLILQRGKLMSRSHFSMGLVQEIHSLESGKSYESSTELAYVDRNGNTDSLQLTATCSQMIQTQ